MSETFQYVLSYRLAGKQMAKEDRPTVMIDSRTIANIGHLGLPCGCIVELEDGQKFWVTSSLGFVMNQKMRARRASELGIPDGEWEASK